LNLTNEGVAAAHGWVNSEGPSHHRPDKEVGHNRARAGDQGPSVVINVQPCRKSPHDIEKLNCSSEFFVYRGRETVRGFASREHEGWINPLTKPVNGGREKLKKK